MQTKLEKQIVPPVTDEKAGKNQVQKNDLTNQVPEQVQAGNEAFQKESAAYLENKSAGSKRKGVYGTDGERISIEKTDTGYAIKGNPDETTRKIFEALLTTPKGVEVAMDFTKNMYEFKFRLLDVVYDDDTKEKVHAVTYEADENELIVKPENKNVFDHFNVDVSLTTTYDTDRMKGWSDEMKLNAIVSHEKGHVSGSGSLQDEDHKSGDSYRNELETLFQYNILYQGNSAINEPWLQNYNDEPDIGYKMVNKAYTSAVKALIKEGKKTEAEGNKMIKDFTTANVAK